MIYLNDGMTGGETRFFADMEQAFRRRPYLSVRPKEGMALVFLHAIWHEGAVVRAEVCAAHGCDVQAVLALKTGRHAPRNGS